MGTLSQVESQELWGTNRPALLLVLLSCGESREGRGKSYLNMGVPGVG